MGRACRRISAHATGLLWIEIASPHCMPSLERQCMVKHRNNPARMALPAVPSALIPQNHTVAAPLTDGRWDHAWLHANDGDAGQGEQGS